MAMDEGGEGSPIHGDLLEVILAHVPLVDLATASRVSKSWEFAVSSSLLHLNKLKPWLLIHTQCRRSFKNKPILAYDPRSHSWIQLLNHSQSHNYMSLSLSELQIQSSTSNFLYQISPNLLSFSIDPLHQRWHQIPPPRSWRVDPIVAHVGSHIVVAGGASGFGDDPLSVEMYNMETSDWSTCHSMPDILKDSSTSTWLSVASNQESMYVIEKASGILYSFRPETKAWAGPYYLRPDPSAFFSAVGFAGDDLILAGVIGCSEKVTALKIWKIRPESMECDEIGEIPSEFLERLKEEDSDLSSISLMAAKDLIYICNSWNPTEIIYCEFVDGEEWKWGSVKNVALNDERRIGERMVMSCGRVEIDDIHMAINMNMKSGNLKLLVNSSN